VASLAPTNPFLTPPYVAARTSLGDHAWILGLQKDGRWTAACLAFLKAGRLTKSAEIPSLPSLSCEQAIFWHGVLAFARRHRIWELFLESFASPYVALPTLAGDQVSRVRYEYILDLSTGNLWQTLLQNHRRNVSRAQKEGLVLRRISDVQACEMHSRSILASLQRRAARGEVVAAHGNARFHRALIDCGAGELFQAVRGNQVLSSVLVLKAAQGAYYQSAGTLPNGMACGASHFLIHEVAQVLKAENIHFFNLGGAGADDLGLRRFKAGFGARELRLEAVELILASRIKRKLRTVGRVLFHDPRDLLRTLLGSPEGFVV
jgi:hypothetical protein